MSVVQIALPAALTMVGVATARGGVMTVDRGRATTEPAPCGFSVAYGAGGGPLVVPK